MVKPVTIAAAAASISSVAKIGAGVLGSIRAKRRGEFKAKQYEEQARIIGFLGKRKQTKAVGALQAQAGARGTTVSSDVLFDNLFDSALEKVGQQQQAWTQATQARITGETQGQQALGAGFGGAIGTLGAAGQQIAEIKLRQAELDKK